MYDRATIDAVRAITAKWRGSCGHSCACIDYIDREVVAMIAALDIPAPPVPSPAEVAGMRAAAGPLRVHELTGGVIESIDVDDDTAVGHIHVAVVLPDQRTHALLSTQPRSDTGGVEMDGNPGPPDAWVLFDITGTGRVTDDANPTDWQTRVERHGEDS